MIMLLMMRLLTMVMIILMVVMLLMKIFMRGWRFGATIVHCLLLPQLPHRNIIRAVISNIFIKIICSIKSSLLTMVLLSHDYYISKQFNEIIKFDF